MAFTINKNVVFTDSMQFMNSSLDKLVKNLKDEGFKYFSKEYSGKQLKLVKEKGTYTYEYMDSFKRFNEDKLPDKSKFFSSLKDGSVNDEYYERANKVWTVFKIKTLRQYHDLYLKAHVLLLLDVFEKKFKICLNYYGSVNDEYYERANKVWKVFKIKTLRQYHDLYLKTHVLLLLDVFEKNFKICLNCYGLVPCHYFSLPGLNFDTMLKMTGDILYPISEILFQILTFIYL